MKTIRLHTLTFAVAGALALGSASVSAKGTQHKDEKNDPGMGTQSQRGSDQESDGDLSADAKMNQANLSKMKLTDDEIAQVLLTANKGEIEQSEMALKDAKNEEVRSFAQMMIDEHKSNTEKLQSLLQKTQMSPDQNAVSENLQSKAQRMSMELKDAKGENVDRVYSQNAVAMHRDLLTMIDKQLLPNAKNPELRSHLQQTRARVAEHLQHAQKLPGASASQKTASSS